MLELLAAGVVGIFGHTRTKDFVRRRLRYTHLVEKPGLGLMTGAATFVVTGAVVAALPLVGAGAGVVVGLGAGLGVGTGVARGASQARRGEIPDEF